MMQKAAMKQAFKAHKQELLGFVAQQERQQVVLANDFLELAGVEWRLPVPDVDDRTDQLADAILAYMDGEYAEFFVREYAAVALVGGNARPEQAARYADMDADAWDRQKRKWQQAYEEQGVTGTPKEIAQAHIGRQFDVDLETFERVVVEWDDDKREQWMQWSFGGQPPGADPLVFVGFETASTALRTVMDALTEE